MDFGGKTVLLRLDLNVRIFEGRVIDDFRIRMSLPTMRLLKNAGAKTVILSHIDSPETDSLEILSAYLNNLFPVSFARTFEELQAALPTLPAGSFVMFENLRRHPGEESLDEDFTRRLAALGNVFVNEAFSVSHRAHSSIALLPKFLPSYAGLRFAEEVEKLSGALQPLRPALLLAGGAKFETKLPLVEKFLRLYDRVAVVGALANDCFKAKGFNIGSSAASGKSPDLSHVVSNPKLFLPSDVLVRNPKGIFAKDAAELQADDKIVDIGPKTLDFFGKFVGQFRFVLWNGPLGVYEEGFRKGTEDLVKIIAAADVKSIVGGGDTYAAISSLGAIEKFDFISTGGGAMLDFLANETLPGIEALENNPR